MCCLDTPGRRTSRWGEGYSKWAPARIPDSSSETPTATDRRVGWVDPSGLAAWFVSWEFRSPVKHLIVSTSSSGWALSVSSSLIYWRPCASHFTTPTPFLGGALHEMPSSAPTWDAGSANPLHNELATETKSEQEGTPLSTAFWREMASSSFCFR